jgi:hypothetical protein
MSEVTVYVPENVAAVVSVDACPPVIVELDNQASADVSIVYLGERGPAGVSGGNGSTGTAVEAISALRVVSETAVGLSLANPASEQSMLSILGVSTNAASIGGTLTVTTRGMMTDPSWSWTVGSQLYVGAAGILTATPPASGVLRSVAVALGATTISVAINDPIFLG